MSCSISIFRFFTQAYSFLFLLIWYCTDFFAIDISLFLPFLQLIEVSRIIFKKSRNPPYPRTTYQESGNPGNPSKLVWTRGAVCPPERGTCESRSQQIAGTSLSRFRRRGHQSKRILIEQKSKKHRKFLDPSAKPCRGFVVETAGPVLDP